MSLVRVSFREETKKVIDGIEFFLKELGVICVMRAFVVEVEVHGDGITLLSKIEGLLWRVWFSDLSTAEFVKVIAVSGQFSQSPLGL